MKPTFPPTTYASLEHARDGVTMSRMAFLVAVVMMAAPSFAQSLSLSPSSPTGCKPATGTITLPAVAVADVEFTLGSGNVAATVPPTVSVLAGQSSTSFVIATTAVAASTSVVITATGGAAVMSRSLTIRPLAPIALTVSPNRLGPGGSGTGTVTLTCAAGPDAVIVNLVSNNAALTVPASITVPLGQQSGSFGVSAGTVALQTSVSVTATTAGGSRSTTVTLKPPTVTNLAFSPSTPIGGSPATGTITLDSPAGAGGLVVQLASSDPTTAAPDQAQITIGAGSTTGDFGVTTSSVINDVTVTFTATANGATLTRTLRVRKNRIENFNVSAPVLTGCRDVTATVKLFAPAGAGGVAIDVTNNRPDLAVLSATSVTVPEGLQTATFSLSAAGPITSNETVDIAVVLTRSPTDIQTETGTFDVLRTSPVACP